MTTAPRLSLKAMRAFAEVVERGSIAGAAETLHVAASAVSAALDQVEAEFGATLLVRKRASGVSATAEGREIAAGFRRLLEDYATLLDEGQRLTQRLTGHLRIGYYAPVAPAFLPGLLHPLMADNPGLRVELQAHDNDSAQEAALAGQLDVILFAGQDVRRGITTQHLKELPAYVLARADHAIARQSHASLAQVAQHPLVLLDRPLARPYVEGLFATEGLSPDIVARADTVEMVRSLVGAGTGLAVLSMRPLTNRSYGGDALVCVPLDPTLPGLALFAGYATAQPRQVVRVFLNLLERYMRSAEAARLTVTV